MGSFKVFLVSVALLSLAATFTQCMHISPSPPDLTEETINEKDEQKARSKRFNFFPGLFNTFNSEDWQVQTLLQQQRALNRVQRINNNNNNNDLFSRDGDNFYLQGLLQQRRIRQRYYDITGERVSYYNDDNYNNRYNK